MSGRALNPLARLQAETPMTDASNFVAMDRATRTCCSAWCSGSM
jgi:hypothetical protein